MYKLIIVFLAVLTKILSEKCEHIRTLNLTVYQTIDSAPENEIVSDIITLNDDAFHLLLANATVPRLCPNFVQINNELSVLQIINSSVSIIDPGAFHIVPTLTLLKISFNLLTNIKSGVFNSIKVKEIDLSRNFISVIENESFDNNTNLEILKLNHNAIKEISPNWFRNSPHVYKFSIIYNEVMKIPPDAFKNFARNRALKLRLSANRISEIDPESFAGCGDIDILRLNGNKLVTLPEQIFANKTIRRLEVNTNRLLCFPDILYDSKLERLEFLENSQFNCSCLNKVKTFVDKTKVDIMYPAIICEDKEREINVVYNFNKTYEIPLLTTSTSSYTKR